MEEVVITMTAIVDYGSCQDRESPEDSERIGSSSSSSSSPIPFIISTGFLVVVSIILILLSPSSSSSSSSHQLPLLTMMAEEKQQTDNNIIPDPSAYPRRLFITRTNTSIPILGFPSVSLARLSNAITDQPLANTAVRHGSRQDLTNTLRALQTDHLDLYQFHSISTQEDVDQILGENGAMKTFQQAKLEGKIKAIGFSAHSEPMAIQMIQSGLVDTCMFPINFVSYHYGGVGQGVLDAALQHKVGVIALKSGARGRLTTQSGDAVHVPPSFHHIPEWKRQEMIHYPVVTSPKYYTWYEPEDDPVELNKLVLWALNQRGVTAVLPPGTMDLLDGISDMLRGKSEVPKLSEEDVEGMKRRYEKMDIVPIFHNRSVSGTKVST